MLTAPGDSGHCKILHLQDGGRERRQQPDKDGTERGVLRVLAEPVCVPPRGWE